MSLQPFPKGTSPTDQTQYPRIVRPSNPGSADPNNNLRQGAHSGAQSGLLPKGYQNAPQINKAEWVQNYAYTAAGLDSPEGFIALSTPRLDYTWMLEFQISDEIPLGDFREGYENKRILSALKSCTKPSYSYEVEKLKSYNTIKNIIKRVEYKDITVGFYDDSTSYISGLLNAYRAYHTYSGLVNSTLETTNLYELVSIEPSSIPGYGDTTQTVDDLSLSPYTRLVDNTIPSMGIRQIWKPFFNSIVLYDLGTEPSSIDIYVIVRPTITSIDKGNFDYSSSNVQEINVTFSYEELIEYVGVSITDDAGPYAANVGIRNIKDVLSTQLGTDVEPSPNLSDRAGTFNNTNDYSQAVLKSEAFVAQQKSDISNQNQSGTFGSVITAIQSAIQGGELNVEALGQNLFRTVAKGTPIQDLREAYKTAKQIEQAIEQGRYTDIAGLLSEYTIFTDGIGSVFGDAYKSADDLVTGILDSGKSWINERANDLPPWMIID